MPQLLNYIDVPADDDSGLDFGTIAIYRCVTRAACACGQRAPRSDHGAALLHRFVLSCSCSESCALEVHPQTGAYAEEFVFVQQHA
jgi:hypothetical protein